MNRVIRSSKLVLNTNIQMAKERSKLIVFGTLEELEQPMITLLLNSGHNENASLVSLTEEALLLFWEEGWGCGNEIDNDNSQPSMSSSSAPSPTLQVFPTSFRGCLSFNLATCPNIVKKGILYILQKGTKKGAILREQSRYILKNHMDFIIKLIQHLMIIICIFWCKKRAIREQSS